MHNHVVRPNRSSIRTHRAGISNNSLIAALGDRDATSGSRAMLFHLVYVSRGAGKIDDQTLLAIQRSAVRFNKARHLTGVLFYSGGHFMQLLEGSPQALGEVYDRIYRDPRHADLECLFFGPAHERVFATWSMGVFDLDSHVESRDWSSLRAMVRNPERVGNGQAQHRLFCSLFNAFRDKVSDSGIGPTPDWLTANEPDRETAAV